MSEPWDMDWSGFASRVDVAPRGSTEKNPWEQDWSGMLGREEAISAFKESRAARSTSFNAGQEDHKFDQVFDRLIQAESRGKHFTNGKLTTSPVGARGITQVMPRTGRDPGYGVTPLQDESKEEFVRFGKDYLKAMLGVFDGDYPKAVAAYNAGPGNVQKAVAKAEKHGGKWEDYLPKKSETLPYMERILGVNNGA